MTSQQSDSELTSSLATVGDPPPSRPRRSWLQRLWRWLLALVIIGGLVFGVYLLWPSIDERFVQPISNNADNILTMTERIDALEARIAEVESRTAEIVEAEQTNTTSVAAVEGQLTRLEARLDAQQARLEGLEDTAFRLADADAEAAAQTERELAVLRAMGLMSRARLSLYQANYGLAREDLVAARGVLADIGDRDGTISEAMERVSTSIESLPDLPVPAAADVDIAWQMLLGNVAVESTTTTAPATSTSQPSTTSTTAEDEPEG